MGSGSNKAGQREPHEWLGTTVRTLCKVDTGDLLHPLHHTWWVAWGGSGGLAQGLRGSPSKVLMFCSNFDPS